jgi:hypothetical protein
MPLRLIGCHHHLAPHGDIASTPKPAVALGDLVVLQPNNSSNREYCKRRGYVTKIADDMADVLLAGYPPQLAPFHYQWPLEYLKPSQLQTPYDRPEEAAKAAAYMLVLRYNEGYQAGHAQALEDARVPKPAEVKLGDSELARAQATVDMGEAKSSAYDRSPNEAALSAQVALSLGDSGPRWCGTYYTQN